MNEDVLEVLRRADPASNSSGYDDARIAQQISRIVRAHPEAERAVRRPRSRTRQWGVPTAAFVAVAGTGLAAAAAAGWLSPEARRAFDSPDARQSLLGLYGSTADLDRARERVAAPGPDGSTVSTWTVPVADRGTCTAILVSKRSAPVPVGSGQRSDLPTVCEAVPAAGQVQRSIRFTALEWRSRGSGTDYLIYSGPLGRAAQMRLQLTSGARLAATVRDGYYLLPAVPVADITCAALVGLDRQGHQVGLASYLGTGCPGDPYQPAPQPPAPTPGSTITENEPSQAVGYSTGVGVNVAAVIRQDPGRGAGSSVAGMSLVTVRLQFYRQPPDPGGFPATVSFDLLYGHDQRAAVRDAGKHHDPDLSGDWKPPRPDPTVWLPQQSFDVPTDQLATLRVRINGDGTRPTVIFGNVRVTE